MRTILLAALSLLMLVVLVVGGVAALKHQASGDHREARRNLGTSVMIYGFLVIGVAGWAGITKAALSSLKVPGF